MVTIYALINPFNNEPFYVGSTVNTYSRLSTHHLCYEGTTEKRQLIKYIKSQNKRAILMPLLVCSEKAASKCETYIYNLLLNHGYTLFNDKSRIDSRQRYDSPDHWLKSPLITLNHQNKPTK